MFLFLATAFTGCVSYQPLPITQESVRERLSTPSTQEIQIQVRAIKHPLLKPVIFDLSDGLSPDEAAILAVITNPSLRVARDSRGLATAQVLQAGILPNPQLSSSLESPVGGDTSGKVNAFALGLNWDITSLISRGSEINSARFHAASVDLEIAWKEWQVAEAAKLCVYRLIVAQNRCALAKTAENIAEKACRAVKKAVSLDLKTVPELTAAHALLRKTHASVIEEQSKLIYRKLELNRILGFPSSKSIRIVGKIPRLSKKDIPPLKRLTNHIEKNRLDLLALRYGYESQEERLRVAIQQQFPKISLGFTTARDTDRVKTIGAGISISLPILDRNQGRIALKRATRKQLFDEYCSRLFEARANTAKIIEELRGILKQLDNVQKSIYEVRELAKHYQRAAEYGNADIVDYYPVLLQLYAKRTEELSLKSRMMEFAVGLEIASGEYLFSVPIGDG